jgi:hypothetical protein
MYRWVLQVDVRSVLQSIQAPTLILHRAENRHYRVPMGRYLAEHIPGAKYMNSQEQTGTRPFVNAQPVLDEIEESLTGARPVPAQDRILATVLFTDIVGSTDLTARLGDQRRLDLRAGHSLLRSRRSRAQGHSRRVAAVLGHRARLIALRSAVIRRNAQRAPNGSAP